MLADRHVPPDLAGDAMFSIERARAVQLPGRLDHPVYRFGCAGHLILSAFFRESRGELGKAAKMDGHAVSGVHKVIAPLARAGHGHDRDPVFPLLLERIPVAISFTSTISSRTRRPRWLSSGAARSSGADRPIPRRPWSSPSRSYIFVLFFQRRIVAG